MSLVVRRLPGLPSSLVAGRGLGQCVLKAPAPPLVRRGVTSRVETSILPGRDIECAVPCAAERYQATARACVNSLTLGCVCTSISRGGPSPEVKTHGGFHMLFCARRCVTPPGLVWGEPRRSTETAHQPRPLCLLPGPRSGGTSTAVGLAGPPEGCGAPKPPQPRDFL